MGKLSKFGDVKHTLFKIIGVISLIWWFFILYTMIGYVVMGCTGSQCSLEIFTEKVLTKIYSIALVLAFPSGVLLYKKVLVKRPFIMKIVFILSALLLFYVLFFNI